MGGHVIFSHYAYFDALLDAALPGGGGSGGSGGNNSSSGTGGLNGDGSGNDSGGNDSGGNGSGGNGSGGNGSAWNVHQRASYVRLKGRWVPYPFQNNLAALDRDDQAECLAGLVEAAVATATARGAPANFDEWIVRAMGRGIADLFMRPYNFKVWAVPPAQMQCAWLGERVAAVDAARAVRNAVRGVEDAGWGPNATFRFPKNGGTGAIWRGVAALLPRARLRFGCRVVGVDKDARVVTLASGTRVRYDKLLTTLPLDLTLRWLGRADLAEGLVHSSTHVVGVGLRGAWCV